MTIAEFIEKLKQYPQHMVITLHGSDYGAKIYGDLPEVNRLIELVNCYDSHEEPMRWADPITLRQRNEITP